MACFVVKICKTMYFRYDEKLMLCDDSVVDKKEHKAKVSFKGIYSNFYVTRKSSCVNARGILTAACQVLHLLSCMGWGTPARGYPTLGTPITPGWGTAHLDLAGVPPCLDLVGVLPGQTWMGYPHLDLAGVPLSGPGWGTPWSDLDGVPPSGPGWGTPTWTWPRYRPPVRHDWGTPHQTQPGYPSGWTWLGYPPGQVGYPPSKTGMGYPPGWTWPGYPPVDRQTDTCQNITFPSYYVRGW